jgi:hypothetical protein
VCRVYVYIHRVCVYVCRVYVYACVTEPLRRRSRSSLTLSLAISVEVKRDCADGSDADQCICCRCVRGEAQRSVACTHTH